MTTERIEAFWRDATAADIARVMSGEKVEARFRDDIAFYNSTLSGWVKDYSPYVWIDGEGSNWKSCQVYDPPQWFIDKPDPGEGYRLLGKFPDEDLQPGDEVLKVNGKWAQSLQAKSSGVQVDSIWYRRKIEQPKPESKHYTLHVGDTVQTPSGHRITVTELGIGVQ